jgi:hypothetical protein
VVPFESVHLFAREVVMPVKFDSESFGENLKRAVFEREREAASARNAMAALNGVE